ncbi:hypothetical protein DOJK_00898 [Patescibacteria group bacterium]|nr:hypothetical protein DOJK_00898 [Patescibacteria group bacterium]
MRSKIVKKLSSYLITNSGILLKIVSVACSISAIILISLAIALPHGITYYEDNMIIKILEILISCFAIMYLLHDLNITISKNK